MEQKVWQRGLSLAFASILVLSLIHTEVLASNTIRVISEEVRVSTSSSGSSFSTGGSAGTIYSEQVNEEVNALVGEVKLNEEEAIERFRELFPILREAEVERAELRSDYPYPSANDEQLVWEIGWRYQEGNSSYGFNSSIDANTGDLFSVHISSPFREENQVYYPPRVSEAEAKERAKAFIEKAVPSINSADLYLDEHATHYTNQPLFGPVQYHFNFIPVIDGVPSPDAGLSLTVDGNGQILSFHRRYAITEYPSATPAISKEQAEQKYAEQIQLSLHYMTVADDTVFLGWVPDQQVGPFDLIDAQSGEFIDYTGKVVTTEYNPYVDIPETGSSFRPLEPIEGEFISAEQAAALVEQIATIPDNRSLTSKTRGKDWRNEQVEVWNLRWMDDGERFYRPFEETSAMVNARTGQLIEYREDMLYRSSSDPITETKNNAVEQAEFSVKELQLVAFDFVNKLFPHPQTELKWFKREDSSPTLSGEDHYYFRFQRFYQDIPMQQDGVTIRLDKYGKLKEYRLEWVPDLEEKVRGLEAKITQEEAQAQYLADTSLQLRYQYLRAYTPDAQVKPSTKLVYGQQRKPGLGYGYAIDAVTGHWRSSWDPGTSEGVMIEPIDIHGHPAEEALRTLVHHQIMKADEYGNINPDEVITYGEWLYMMAKAVQPHVERYVSYDPPNLVNVPKENPYYPAVQLASRYGWINTSTKHVPLDEALTREKLAGSLTYILGYNKLVTFLGNEQDLAQYVDAEDIQAKGAVSLISKFGLLEDKDGRFAPQSQVTRAEAAAVIMRLVYLQGKTDREIGGYR